MPGGWAGTDAILCGAATVLALSAGRNVSTFALIVTPVLSYHAAAVLADRGWTIRPMQRATGRIAALNLLLILLVLGIAASRAVDPFRDNVLGAAERAELPVDATAYLRSHGTQGRLFNAYDWGGYLIDRLPDVPVFVDGRSDLDGGAFLREPYLFTASGGPEWEQQLGHYRIGTVLIRSNSGLATVLREREVERCLRGRARDRVRAKGRSEPLMSDAAWNPRHGLVPSTRSTIVRPPTPRAA